MERYRLRRTPPNAGAYMEPAADGRWYEAVCVDARIAELEAQAVALTAERDQARREHADAQHRYTVAMHDISKACAGTTARSACEVVELWRKERDAQAEAVRVLGGAVRTTRAHVWTETPGIEVQVFADPDVPHSLRLVVRDVHAKEDLASVRIEAFRLDLLCGPIARLWIEYQARIARAAVEGGSK